MAKQKRILSYSVLVEPCSLGYGRYGSISDHAVEPDADRCLELYRERCEKMAEQIHRHIDNVGSATVEIKTKAVCEHCGSGWTEDTDVHNGGCCDIDCEAMDAAEAKEK